MVGETTRPNTRRTRNPTSERAPHVSSTLISWTHISSTRCLHGALGIPAGVRRRRDVGGARPGSHPRPHHPPLLHGADALEHLPRRSTAPVRDLGRVPPGADVRGAAEPAGAVTARVPHLRANAYVRHLGGGLASKDPGRESTMPDL